MPDRRADDRETTEREDDARRGNGSERDRFVAFAFCWADALVELDADGRIRYVAGTLESITGTPRGKLMDTAFLDLVADRDKPLARELMAVAAKRGRIENATIRLAGTHGATVPLSLAGYRLDELGGRTFLALRSAGTAAFAADGRKLARDPVSGLYEAEDFAGLASRRLKDAETAGTRAELTLIAMPAITGLKQRLDDEARRGLVGTLSAALRANSVGGDSAAEIADGKYAIVHEAGLDLGALETHLTEVTREADPEGVGAAAETATIDVGDGTLDDEDLANGLVYAINQFKETKGADFILKNFSTNLSAMVDQAMNSVHSFRRIVDEASFDVAFHPIVDTGTGAIHHYEALARFHGAGDDHSPFKVITFAEEVGLIWKFDIAMARKVVAWLKERRARNYKVAVNISGRSIGNLSYLAELHELLKRHSWASKSLMFEITESARIADLGAANRFFQTLRHEGCEVCLDDFGAGAASFQYLASLDVDVVKLDGSAVKNALSARKGRAFLSALATLCRDIGVETVAEMIDDKETLNFVRACGIDYAQGYLFGKPSTDIEAFAPEALARHFR